MGLIFRRRVGRRRLGRNAATWTNLSGSGLSQTVRAGRVTVNSRGRVTVRLLPGLSWRGRL